LAHCEHIWRRFDKQKVVRLGMISPTSSPSFPLPNDKLISATAGTTSAATTPPSSEPFKAQDCETNVATPITTTTTATQPTDLEMAQQQESLLLYTLARQLEYYFSPQNLATDLYLRTLRDLNNGCVPVTILANFGKVRAGSGSKNHEQHGAAPGRVPHARHFASRQ
jgi:La domain